MILYPMNELLTNVSSRYELVNLVAHRARQLYSEAEKKKEELEEKPVTVALNEAWNGTLTSEAFEAPEQPEAQAEEASDEQAEAQPAEEPAVAEE